MKIVQKYLYILALTGALICAVVCFTPKADLPLPNFAIRNPGVSENEEISIHRANDGNYYVFLPSYAELELVTVSLPRDHSYTLGNTPLTDNMNCGNFTLETPYRFAVDQQEIATLWFFRSANVATLYMDTTSGNMNYIHQNKEHKETVSLRLYTTSGEMNYADDLSTLKGRGNATWEYDKRPYNLTLSSDTSLLDMAPAANWVLLANAADETNLNNHLIFSLAERAGMGWSPECRWVDLYLNGEYHGLYQLTEKVEVHENRLALDLDSGDFLCKIDLYERFTTLRNPFLTEAGRTVEISYPKILKEGALAEIESRVHEMEQEILSGSDLRRSTVLDLDSWVRRYLIDEISANIDSDLASSYFYCSDGVFYAGPLWDYDMTLGNFPRNHDPCAFVAKNAQKASILSSPFYGALYGNPSFYNRMVELYRTEFLPELQKLMDSELDALIASISKASQSNSLRWRSMYDNMPADVVHTPEALKDYLARRVQFLNRAWLDNVPYFTIQFETSPGFSYLSVSVEKGHYLESTYINTEQLVWIDTETGEVFDFSQPVTADKILTRQIS